MIIRCQCCHALCRSALTEFWQRKSTFCLPEPFIHSPGGPVHVMAAQLQKVLLKDECHPFVPHVLFLGLRHGSGANLRLQNSLDVMCLTASFNSEKYSSISRGDRSALKFWRHYAISCLGFIWFDNSASASHSVEQTLIGLAKDVTNSLPLKSECAFWFFMTEATLSWYYILFCNIYVSQHTYWTMCNSHMWHALYTSTATVTILWIIKPSQQEKNLKPCGNYRTGKTAQRTTRTWCHPVNFLLWAGWAHT